MQKHLWSVLALLTMAFLALGSTDSNSSNTSKTPAEARKERIERHFRTWDGSHLRLTEWIKKSMNNPKSYEHVETSYIDKGDFLIVTTEFRGTNEFGGVVKNSVIAKVDLNGNVVEIIGSFP